MSLFFRVPLDIEVRLDGEDTRETVEVKSAKGRKEKLPVYKDGETVKGQVSVRLKDNKRVEHLGIKVQLLGSIETKVDGIKNDEFLSMAHELASPGDLRHPETYHFEFRNVEKQYESYRGKNVRLRYYIKVTLGRKSADVIRERELWVFQKNQLPLGATKPDASIKMDVGIEDCLHIEFEYSRNRFSLKDVIVGRIYFLLVRLKIKHMELSLIRRESCGAPPNQVNDSETLVRFEIMDGAPVRGETIPIRLFLGGFDLTPTYRDVNKKFSTRTFLSLVLIDEDARRYFKQSEIFLYRE
ncbi:BA75_03247T0 [Komagataella pastoris]|uniref:BA75_03247T0 n=1 Tax=Komagataella pastoris TaxID=4922 RepID=A0A1B2JB50_PICPA|nr:BA75_03247T0 [Komagataella pastoris]